jgi:hypothetical protein
MVQLAEFTETLEKALPVGPAEHGGKGSHGVFLCVQSDALWALSCGKTANIANIANLTARAQVRSCVTCSQFSREGWKTANQTANRPHGTG